MTNPNEFVREWFGAVVYDSKTGNHFIVTGTNVANQSSPAILIAGIWHYEPQERFQIVQDPTWKV